jgi:hypothetical protein
MVELVVMVCLLVAPSTCERFPLPFVAPMSMRACLLQAPKHLAAWERDHPAWRIRTYWCGPPEA